MPAEATRTRRALGRALAVARVAAGGTYRSIGDAIGKSHTHVQRVEKGSAPVSFGEATAWLDATAAPADTRDTVLALVAAAAEEAVAYRPRERGHTQAEAAARIDAADAIDTYQPHVVPGLLQTERYARELGVPKGYDLSKHVAARLERQAVLTSGRRFRFVLRSWVLTNADEEQRGKVAAVAGGAVEVRVLEDPRPFMLATVGFMIYTVAGVDTAVRMELPHAELGLDGIEDVAAYRAVFADLYDAARPIDEF